MRGGLGSGEGSKGDLLACQYFLDWVLWACNREGTCVGKHWPLIEWDRTLRLVKRVARAIVVPIYKYGSTGPEKVRARGRLEIMSLTPHYTEDVTKVT